MVSCTCVSMALHEAVVDRRHTLSWALIELALHTDGVARSAHAQRSRLQHTEAGPVASSMRAACALLRMQFEDEQAVVLLSSGKQWVRRPQRLQAVRTCRLPLPSAHPDGAPGSMVLRSSERGTTVLSWQRRSSSPPFDADVYHAHALCALCACTSLEGELQAAHALKPGAPAAPPCNAGRRNVTAAFVFAET
jgi:hypothetical protein